MTKDGMSNPAPVVGFNDRLTQFNVARGMAMQAYAFVKKKRDEYLERGRYYVSVEDNDDLFDVIQEWMIAEKGLDEYRSINAETKTIYNDVWDERGHEVKLFAARDYDTSVVLEDHEICVEVTSRKA